MEEMKCNPKIASPTALNQRVDDQQEETMTPIVWLSSIYLKIYSGQATTLTPLLVPVQEMNNTAIQETLVSAIPQPTVNALHQSMRATSGCNTLLWALTIFGTCPRIPSIR